MKNDQQELVNFPHLVRKTIDYITRNFSEDISLEDMAAHCNVNKFTYIRIFKTHTEQTPIKWLWEFRVHVSASLIKNHPSLSLTDVAFACGFKSSAHFSRSFKAVFQSSPRAFQKQFRPQIKKKKLEVPADLFSNLDGVMNRLLSNIQFS